MIKSTINTSITLTVLWIIAGCAQQQSSQTASQATAAMVTSAICVMHPTEGNNVAGTVTFTKTDAGIKVVADISGLSEGKHGFHIHQLGDCSAPDGTSSGGHFNPTGMPHGAPTDSLRHIGDLGNLEAGADGNAHYEWTDTHLSLEGSNSIVGRAMIIHAGEDDLKSQPTGAAGARVACGVIGIDASE